MIEAAISDSDLSKQQVSKISGVPWTTLCRRLEHPESSFFTIPEIISVCGALGLDFIEVLAEVQSASGGDAGHGR